MESSDWSTRLKGRELLILELLLDSVVFTPRCWYFKRIWNWVSLIEREVDDDVGSYDDDDDGSNDDDSDEITKKRRPNEWIRR